MLVKFVKLILTIPGLLKYFEIVIVVITEEPLKKRLWILKIWFQSLQMYSLSQKEICSSIRSPVLKDA